MIRIIDKAKCCGCSACVFECPQKCIEMKRDLEGFVYPNIAESNCINCGRCNRVCPVESNDFSKSQPKTYAAFSKNNNVQKLSSSGGIFFELSKYVLSQNGVICGAYLDNYNHVRHGFALNESELYPLLGSKYVQSNINDCFQNVKSYLEKGILLLFAGTPCQVAGLKKYLKKEYDNLLSVDVVCHGVSSPLVWEKYLDCLGENVTNVNFRDKSKGWIDYSFSYQKNNKRILCNGRKNEYMNLYLSGLPIRPSCQNCSFKMLHHSSDITLGDFWGIENVNQKVYSSNGTSLVLIHSALGEKMFEAVSQTISSNECDISEALKYNPSILTSSKPNNKRSSFFADVQRDDFKSLYKKYLNKSIIKAIKDRIHRIVNQQIRGKL